jgi:hypothetical protein
MADELTDPTAEEVREVVKKVERNLLPEILEELDHKTAQLDEIRAAFEKCPDPALRAEFGGWRRPCGNTASGRSASCRARNKKILTLPSPRRVCNSKEGLMRPHRTPNHG